MGMCKPSGGISTQTGKIGDLKSTGVPNTRIDLYDENGELLQQRWYGREGNAIWNRDWNHKDNNPKKPHTFPHDHPWDWGQKKPRLDYNEFREINTDYC